MYALVGGFIVGFVTCVYSDLHDLNRFNKKARIIREKTLERLKE